jgi:hypothetical protein
MGMKIDHREHCQKYDSLVPDNQNLHSVVIAPSFEQAKQDLLRNSTESQIQVV